MTPLVQMYRAGSTLAVIAARYGKSETWVRDQLRKAKEPRRHRGCTPASARQGWETRRQRTGR